MDGRRQSETFPSIFMEVEIIAYKLTLKVKSVVDIAKALNLHSLLPKLEELIEGIKYVDHYHGGVAEILKVALCEAEHVVDKYEVYSLQSQLHSRSKTSKVLNFFSGTKHFVLRIWMVLEIEKLVNKWSKTCIFLKITPSVPAPPSCSKPPAPAPKPPPPPPKPSVPEKAKPPPPPPKPKEPSKPKEPEKSKEPSKPKEPEKAKPPPPPPKPKEPSKPKEPEKPKEPSKPKEPEKAKPPPPPPKPKEPSKPKEPEKSKEPSKPKEPEKAKPPPPPPKPSVPAPHSCSALEFIPPPPPYSALQFTCLSDVGLSLEKGRFPKFYRERGLTYTRTRVHYSDVVGRDNDRDIVVEMLLKSGNETSFFVFPIVGVGGIGKTTLAKLVYNDPRIVSHFQLRLWVHVSRVFKVEKLLEQIVNSVREDICENLEMNKLQNLVQETLYGKNCLIVLDDVWNEDPVKWDELKRSLIRGDCGGKILVTTRFDEVASMMGTVPSYCLKGLSSEDSLTLFLIKAFKQGQEKQHPNLISIASDIVQKCEGNPLQLMILGSSLHMETDESKWDDVNDNRMWNSNQNDKILPALGVSYVRLPSHLKVCLNYCSTFPKDCVIEVNKLIQLWLAEGLISQSDGSEDLEHIGIQYFQELLSRSFFQEVEEYRSVYTSICTLHDLVHDLALSAAGIEFCTVNSHTQNISDEVRHVAFSDYDLSGKELPASLLNNQALKTISFSVDGVGPMSSMFVENCLARFMQLRVLDISDSCFDELPSSVGELKYLRYLDVSANGSIKELPDSINKLLSLQTLRVSHCSQLEGLPKDIGNLISLRHLHITTKQACFPDKAIGCLSSLRSLYIHSCNNLVSLSEGLQHLTSLRTLAIIGCPRLTFFPSAMKHLSALENLLIVDCEELTLLEWQDIEGLRMIRSLVIGGLPELESKDVHCLGSLKMLVLAGLPQLVTLPRWLEGASATIQYLRVERCLNFAALPKWLENLIALEKLEISKCHKSFSLPEGISFLSHLKVFRIDN